MQGLKALARLQEEEKRQKEAEAEKEAKRKEEEEKSLQGLKDLARIKELALAEEEGKLALTNLQKLALAETKHKEEEKRNSVVSAKANTTELPKGNFPLYAKLVGGASILLASVFGMVKCNDARNQEATKLAEQQKIEQELQATKQLITDSTNNANRIVAWEIQQKKTRDSLAKLIFDYEMVNVQGGTFQMGDNFGNKEAGNDEKPVHSVTLSSFEIGATEVTQAQWKQIMGKNPSNFKGDNLPVEQVSWNDIQTFLTKLNAKVPPVGGGGGYRLPTEAEWEYAVRERGQNVRFGNGKDVLNPNEANFDGSESYKTSYSVAGKYREKTTPVRTSSPNSLGLYDMAGNVNEWCSDWHASDYYQNSPQNNPQGAKKGPHRVIRGGSWYSNPQNCRAAFRTVNPPSAKFNIIGFRLCRTR